MNYRQSFMHGSAGIVPPWYGSVWGIQSPDKLIKCYLTFQMSPQIKNKRRGLRSEVGEFRLKGLQKTGWRQMSKIHELANNPALHHCNVLAADYTQTALALSER